MPSLGQSHSVCCVFRGFGFWFICSGRIFLQLQHYFHGFLSFFSFSSYLGHNRSLDRKRVRTKSINCEENKNGSLASGWILILRPCLRFFLFFILRTIQWVR